MHCLECERKRERLGCRERKCLYLTLVCFFLLHISNGEIIFVFVQTLIGVLKKN